jgi:hypothetical protein
MKLKHGLILSFAAFLLAGCAGVGQTSASKDQPSERMTAASISAPTAVAQTEETIEKTGTFVSGEHPTQGTVRLVVRADQASIELGSDFETSELGPDLVVILHRSDNVIGSTQPPAYPIQEGDYVVLAPLKQFKGAQSYVIPASVDLSNYRSAGIWCRQFNAMFGAATLTP